jgi:hypothetical protein
MRELYVETLYLERMLCYSLGILELKTKIERGTPYRALSST